MKNNIAVFTEVFNEESRIENLCEFFKWADELIIIDKSSTDRTVEFAKKYTEKVYVVPYADNSICTQQVIKEHKTPCDWYFFPTASSAIDPGLVKALIKLTVSDSFPFDVISLPLKMHVLGAYSKYSPWDARLKNTCIRKTALKLSTEIHQEAGYYGNKVCTQLLDTDLYLYHFTHARVDVLFERHIRYTKEEARAKFDSGAAVLSDEFKALFKALMYVVFKKRTYMMGWDGVALCLAYLSYFSMRFLYTWENLRGLDNSVYSQEIERIKKLWLSEKE